MIYPLESGNFFIKHFKAKIACESILRRQPFPKSTAPRSFFKWAVSLTLRETSIPLLVYITFLLLFVFTYISNFLSFFVPLTSKKKPVCYWLQSCSHVFFPHFCSALLKLAAFYATVLHVAPFLAHPTHRHQTGNCIVSHDLTLHVSTVDVSSKYIAGYSTDGERGRTGNQVPLMMTDCQPHICNTQNYLIFFPFKKKSRGLWFKTSE